MTPFDESFELWVERHRHVADDEDLADRFMMRIRQSSNRNSGTRFNNLFMWMSRYPLARAGLIAACIALGALRLLLITRILLG